MTVAFLQQAQGITLTSGAPPQSPDAAWIVFEPKG
jgi:hypothetical protein